MKQGNKNKEKYLQERRKARKAVSYKISRERNRFADICRRDDWKSELLKIAQRIVKTNQDIFAVQCNRRLQSIESKCQG